MAIVLASTALITATAGVSAAVVGAAGDSAGAQRTASGASATPATPVSADSGSRWPTAIDLTPTTNGTVSTHTAARATAVAVGATTAGPTTPTAAQQPLADTGSSTKTFEHVVPVDPTPQPHRDRDLPDKSECGPPSGEEHQATQAEFEARGENVWLLCTPPSVFGTQEAGLEIRADHQWSKLDRQGDGRLVREHGWGNEGSWQSIDTSPMNGPGHWQLNLDIDGSGTVITQPVFGTTAPVMRLNNEGVYVADYIPASTAGVAGP